MTGYEDFIYFAGTNNPVVNAAVTVMIANTQTPAILYATAAGGTPITNPVTTDQTGKFSFFTTSGSYDLYYLGTKQFQIFINTSAGVPDPLLVNKLQVNTPVVDPFTQMTVTGNLSGDVLTQTGHIITNDATTGVTAMRGFFLDLTSNVVKTGSSAITALRNLITLDSLFSGVNNTVQGFANIITILTTGTINNVIGITNSITTFAGGTVNTITGLTTSVGVLGNSGVVYGTRSTVNASSATTSSQLLAAKLDVINGGVCSLAYSNRTTFTGGAGSNTTQVIGNSFQYLQSSPATVGTISCFTTDNQSTQQSANDWYGYISNEANNAVKVGGVIVGFASNHNATAGKTVYSFYSPGTAPSLFNGGATVGAFATFPAATTIGSTTAAELSYLQGAASNIQAQINAISGGALPPNVYLKGSTFFDNGMGEFALAGLTTGGSNNAVGRNSLAQVNSGIGNTAIGHASGYRVTTGIDNTFIGANSGSNASQKIDASNSTAIGAQTFNTANNQVVIGDVNITETILGGRLKLRVVPVDYADNIAAKAAGLTDGMIYRTGDIMKVVHP